MVKAGISGNRALNYILGTIGCWIIVFYYPFLKIGTLTERNGKLGGV